ncbi:uncharacterized protein yc1106_01561 [Curvularia clavata]|uniref:HIT domain-containing protein n=1 Tax=Curvularia clavata TaxID=95742 RepID=A0A9Q9DP87_CURCL|nr:uncharacterized protein yc1106_01561 [Curvularia clavata]
MQETDLHYPPETCPFCTIAAAHPCPGIGHETGASVPTATTAPPSLWRSASEQQRQALRACVPSDEESDPEKTSPSSFVVLRSSDVVAFLDILPMTWGHLLVTTRQHKVKVADMGAVESREMGFWLPILARTVAKVTGVTDYNIVQNNGARAAQVVPHVHFHIIPRPETMPEIKNKSWTMFGRGQRDELDDEDGARIAGEMRKVLRGELEKMVDEVDGRAKL